MMTDIRKMIALKRGLTESDVEWACCDMMRISDQYSRAHEGELIRAYVGLGAKAIFSLNHYDFSARDAYMSADCQTGGACSPEWQGNGEAFILTYYGFRMDGIDPILETVCVYDPFGEAEPICLLGDKPSVDEIRMTMRPEAIAPGSQTGWC